MIPFVSIDASLANVGVAAGFIDGKDVRVSEVSLLSTKKSSNKQVRASSDTIARCQAISSFVKAWIEKHRPKFIFIETPSGSQNSSGMKSYGVVCMLAGSLPIPPVQVTPNEVKMAATGSKTSSKQEMIDWAIGLYPDLGWYYSRGSLQKKNEHIADAIAVAHAGILTNEYSRAAHLLSVFA